MLRRTDSAISPTALYTSTVWRRHGLSPPAFATFAGSALWTGLVGPRRAVELLGGPHFDALLLARHHAIDTLLEQAIEAGRSRRSSSWAPACRLAAGDSPRATGPTSPTSRPTCRASPAAKPTCSAAPG